MLKVEDICFAYDHEILSDISFKLKHGEILGIVGRSGGGKTSLLKIIGGYLTAKEGAVYFEGKKLKPSNEMLIPGYSNIALVHQDFGLNLYHSVRDNIQEKVLSLPKILQDKLITEMFDLLNLEKLSSQQAIFLSGGEQQRLSIARALVSEADLILLDEPFVHLDSPMKRRLVSYLEKLKQVRNTSFIIVTHNGDEILGLCDKVIYLKKGKIKRVGNPDVFYDKPRSIEEAEFFGLVNSIYINDKRFLFRPDQYVLAIEDGRTKLRIKHIKFSKQGPIFYNYFITDRKEEVILFSFNSMDSVNCIYV